MATALDTAWTGKDVTMTQIERELGRLRDASGAGSTMQRTSVMTHIAWVPDHWVGAARGVLAGLSERHPSRTIMLVPEPDEPDGIDAVVSLVCFPLGDRSVCADVIELTLRGARAESPASIVLPLLMSDLPVFCRWRGDPLFGEPTFEQMLDVVDRLVVDSGEWGELRYDELVPVLERTAVTDIAWARTLPWRRKLAGYWPGIREQEIHLHGPLAEGTLLRAWLGARLNRTMRPLAGADALGVQLGGETLVPPPDERKTAADLLSDELDRFGRDPVYEQAVRAAAISAPGTDRPSA
jgi:Glucose-6-phosphate dehydrogenase subunit N-terminal domain